MRLFTIQVPAVVGSGEPALDRAEFVRDGFHLWAFLLSVIWCLWRGLWIAALAILVASGALFGIGRLLHVSPDAQILAQLVLAFLVGLEAPNLRRFGLRHRGYIDAGAVVASDRSEAEERFFDRARALTPDTATPSAHPSSEIAPSGRPRGTDDVVGLFPEYRGR